MPYWGTITAKNDYEIKVKVNGPDLETEEKLKELKVFIENLAPPKFADIPHLAQYLAKKSAIALRDDPSALWVDVDIQNAYGFCAGFTAIVEGKEIE